MGYREESTLNRGATTESINSLPTYKFKVKKKNHTNDQKTDLGAGESGGIVAAGTEKEHIISGEDAVSRLFYYYIFFEKCYTYMNLLNGSLIMLVTCSTGLLHLFGQVCKQR